MRSPLLTALLLLALAPTTALAHNSHGGCSTSTTVLNTGGVHVDVYTRFCAGAAVYMPASDCALNDVHVLSGVHTPVLSRYQCETGVILEFLA